MIPFEYRGGNYRLYFNGLLLYAFYDRYGQLKSPVEIIEPDTQEAFEACIWLLSELSHQGDLYRRFLGEDPGEVLEYSHALAMVQPKEYAAIKTAVSLAIAEGFHQDHPSSEQQDPWLQEFEAAKSPKKARPGRSIAAWLRGCLAFLFGKA